MYDVFNSCSKSTNSSIVGEILPFTPNDNATFESSNSQSYIGTSTQQLDTPCTSITERKKTIMISDLAYKVQQNKNVDKKNESLAKKFFEKLTRDLGVHYLSTYDPKNKLESVMFLASKHNLIKPIDIQKFIQDVTEYGLEHNYKAICELLADIDITGTKYLEQCYIDFHNFGECNEVDNHLEALSLSLYWGVFIATSDDLYLGDISFFVNNLTFYCFKDLGLDPYVLFKLPPSQLLFICTFNKLLEKNMVYETWAVNLETYQDFPQVLINHMFFLWAEVLPKVLPLKDEAIEFNNPIDMFSLRTKEILLGDFLTTTIINCIHKPKEESRAITASKPAEIYLFGDEFEYSSSVYSTNRKNENYILKVFYNELESYLTSLNVDFNITVDKANLFTTQIITQIIIQVGTFKFKAFMDCDNLEINPTPYKADTVETVTINGKVVQMTRYDAYDMFIFPVIEKLKFNLVSGHKHMDIRQLSPEIILRMIFTTNAESFLPVIYDRCKDLRKYYPYLSEKNIAIIELLENIRAVFNENIASGNFDSVVDSYNDIAILCHVLEVTKVGDKYSALSTHHVAEGEPLLTDQELVDYDFKRLPGSTIENRTYPCPRSGAEVRTFNKFCQANVTLEANRQQKQALISTELKKVTSPLAISKEDAADQFIKSLTEKQLDPTEFKDMIRV